MAIAPINYAMIQRTADVETYKTQQDTKPVVDQQNIQVQVDQREDVLHNTVIEPEENEQLNEAVALSGLPKQEYCYRRCMQRDIVVQPNPRVYKALKTTMEKILSELQRLSDAGGVTDEMRDTLTLLIATLKGMKGDDADGI